METATLEYIETYFQQTMADTERMRFEERIGTDKDFANDVAFYISARQVVKQELLQEKQKDWGADNFKEELTHPIAPVRKIGISKWLSYVAAACLLLFAAFYLFEKKNGSPQQLADKYINKNFANLSNTMDGAKDSIGLGITEYNKKHYTEALKYFEGVEIAHPENIDAKIYTGIGYLFNGEHDKAIQQFDQLANLKGLSTNPGLFFEAIALIQRNKEGDLKTAKQLLQQVVKEKLAHKNEAEEWLKKF